MQEKCIVCEHQVEKQDKVCSNCGTPIDRSEGRKKIVGNIVIVVFLTAIVAGIVWLVKYLI
ncbi:zinc ribbon domain-containing protein [Maridesulfovibrio zosterae]|uniref:zinc ribbon domain-containing protein n=1 Tax=Maridesulfovibrio zosterae TaxID=82171 RepID=UPI00040E70CF|nr:zinc ribbon domain-containing protein [Maridesulfovibrio zosterae]